MMETAALRARNTRAHVGGDVINQIWHEAVDAAKRAKDWLQRHLAALSQQLKLQATSGIELSESFNWRGSYNTAVYSVFSCTSALRTQMTTTLLPLFVLSTRTARQSRASPDLAPHSDHPFSKAAKCVLRRMDR